MPLGGCLDGAQGTDAWRGRYPLICCPTPTLLWGAGLRLSSCFSCCGPRNFFFSKKPPEGSGPPRAKGRCPAISRVSAYRWVTGSYSRMSAPGPLPPTHHPHFCRLNLLPISPVVCPKADPDRPSFAPPPPPLSPPCRPCPQPPSAFPLLLSWVPPLCPVLCLILGPCS